MMGEEVVQHLLKSKLGQGLKFSLYFYFMEITQKKYNKISECYS